MLNYEFVAADCNKLFSPAVREWKCCMRLHWSTNPVCRVRKPLLILHATAVSYDFGKHVKDARPDAVEKWHRVLYIYQNFYLPAIATTKFSVLLFYNRVFPIPRFRILLYILASTVAAWWIATQSTVIFECTPIDFSWDQRGKGHCINLDKFFFAHAIPNIVTDIVLLSIPLPMIWNLQLPRSQKVALSGVFLLGGLYVASSCSTWSLRDANRDLSVVFASIYRLVLLFKLSPTQPDITCMYLNPPPGPLPRGRSKTGSSYLIA